MQAINIHLAEMAGCRALLGKAQFVAKTELHRSLEEYLVRLLFKATKNPHQPFDGKPQLLQQIESLEDLRAIGDQCLLFAGLFPEQAVVRNLPISYFVKVGESAFGEYARHVDDPVFAMLSTFFVEVTDVLQTLREVEHGDSIVDPLDAYQMWHETGSSRAWETLRRITTALPSNECSLAIN